jgi:hypothetical protein
MSTETHCAWKKKRGDKISNHSKKRKPTLKEEGEGMLPAENALSK